MIFICGFGHKKTKDLGTINVGICSRCNNHVSFKFIKVTSWVTFFFIPVIPYSSKYYSVCPICNDSHILEDNEI